jgi:hypothetical protein
MPPHRPTQPRRSPQPQLLQDLAAPFPASAFDVVFDDPEFCPEFPQEEEEEREQKQQRNDDDDDDADDDDAQAAATAVRLVATLLQLYRARQFALLAAIPDERLQLELALLAPLMDAEEQQEHQERERRRKGDGPPPPPLPPRVQFRLLRKQRRACFSIPLEGVQASSLGPLAEHLMLPATTTTSTIQGLSLRASFDVAAAAAAASSSSPNLRVSLSAPAWLRRAGLPPLALPPLPAAASASRPPLLDYSTDTASRLSAHLAAQAPRAAKRHALVDALAAVLGSAALEVAAPAALHGAADVATPPAAAGGGGGGGWGWSAVVSRAAAASSSSSSAAAAAQPALAALFALALDGQPLLLAVEMGARFPDEPPVLRVTRALAPGRVGVGGVGGAAATSSSRGKSSPSADLAEAGQATIAGGSYPWSPRWPADEAAARIYNHLADVLVVADGGGGGGGGKG